MVKRNFWDWLAWIALAGIFVWLILKMLGIINTSVLLQYAPYLGAVYLAGWNIHKLDSVANDVKDLKKFRHETIKEVHEIKLNCAKNHG